MGEFNKLLKMRLFGHWMFQVVPSQAIIDLDKGVKIYHCEKLEEWKFENLKKIISSIPGIKRDILFKNHGWSGNNEGCYYETEAGNTRLFLEINTGRDSEVKCPLLTFKFEDSTDLPDSNAFNRLLEIFNTLNKNKLNLQIFSIPHGGIVSIKEIIELKDKLEKEAGDSK